MGSCGKDGFIPYGRQSIDEDDIHAVAKVLRSDFLTTGPVVAEFEQAVTSFVGAAHGVAVNSGTAALHCALHALGVGSGDEVIVPPMTFAATANAVLYCGAKPVFADVDPATLCIDPLRVEELMTPRTRVVIGVDYAGQPCDWDALRALADVHGVALIADACHALGATCKGRMVGTLADVSCFSFHPVKHIATGEGGMALTDDPSLAKKMRSFRTHGIVADEDMRRDRGAWMYEMRELGFNYRITDIQCALGVSQMKKLPGFLQRRRELAARYDVLLSGHESIRPLKTSAEILHAYHLYVVRLPFADGGASRKQLFNVMRDGGVGLQVHYIPVHLHPYYRKILGTAEGLCPVAEAAYERIVSLPLYPGLEAARVPGIVDLLAGAVQSVLKGEAS